MTKYRDYVDQMIRVEKETPSQMPNIFLSISEHFLYKALSRYSHLLNEKLPDADLLDRRLFLSKVKNNFAALLVKAYLREGIDLKLFEQNVLQDLISSISLKRNSLKKLNLPACEVEKELKKAEFKVFENAHKKYYLNKGGRRPIDGGFLSFKEIEIANDAKLAEAKKSAEVLEKLLDSIIYAPPEKELLVSKLKQFIKAIKRTPPIKEKSEKKLKTKGVFRSEVIRVLTTTWMDITGTPPEKLKRRPNDGGTSSGKCYGKFYDYIGMGLKFFKIQKGPESAVRQAYLSYIRRLIIIESMEIKVSLRQLPSEKAKKLFTDFVLKGLKKQGLTSPADEKKILKVVNDMWKNPTQIY